MTQISGNMGAVGDVDPYPFYASVHASDTLVWDEAMKGWLVVRYDDCKFVEINEDRFRHPYADADDEMIRIKGGRRNVTIMQGEEHLKMHRFLMQMFAPRLVKEYREHHITPIVAATVDRFARQGGAELVRDFCSQIPPRVIMSLMGVDWRDDALAIEMFELHETVMNWIGNQNSGDEQTALADTAATKINEILIPYLRARKTEPQNDLISRVWLEGPNVFSNFGEADVLAATREMFLGGTDTTVHAMSNTLYVLLRDPALMQRVSEDRSAIPGLVDEVLRFFGSVQYRFRIANEDCELRGTNVRKDDVLVLINAAANRDPAKYENAGAIDIDRPRVKDHLAFNAGPRTCVGASIARAEIVDGLNALFDRVTNLRLDPDKEPPRFRKHYIRSFAPLHVLFDTK